MTRIAVQGTPKRLANCLPETLRSALSRRIDEDSRLRHAWHSRVREPLASHAHPVRYAAGLLFIHVDTAAWANRLRHEQPSLIASLRHNPVFRDLAEIRFRVVPKGSVAPAPPATTRPKPTRLSVYASGVVSETASTIADPALRAALERLAQPALKSREPKRRR
jgi:hypothetical protein